MNIPILHPSIVNHLTQWPSKLKRLFQGMFNLNDAHWGRGSDDKPAAPPVTAPSGAPAAQPGQTPIPQSPAPQPHSQQPAQSPSPQQAPEQQPPQQAPQPSPQQQQPQQQRPNNSNQPPDLDEVWRDVNEKLARLFGKKPNNSSGNNSNRQNSNNSGNHSGHNNGGSMPSMPDAKTAGYGLAALLGAIVLIWLATGFYIVQEGQQAVVTRLGKFKGADAGGIATAGVNWRFPYPFEAHDVVQFTQLRSVEVGRNKALQGSASAASGLRDSSMLTQDENIVDVRFGVQYRLDSASDYVFNNYKPDDAVILAAESAVREVVGKGTMNTVLNEKREAIAGDILKSIQAQLKLYKTGILVTSVNIQNVQPPEQVQAAFDDALKASQDGDRAKNEGQAYANDVIPRAEGAAARLREEAEGYKARVVSQAEGDASRFKAILPEYQRAPQVMRDRLYTDTMQQIYSSVTKVMVDTKQGSQLLYLPLDKLMQATATNEIVLAPATTPGLNAAPATAPSASSGPSAIPSPRSRERENR